MKKYPYARRVANVSHFDTRTNLEECIARAHAESNKAGSGPAFYAWNRVLRSLWDIQRDLDAAEKPEAQP